MLDHSRDVFDFFKHIQLLQQILRIASAGIKLQASLHDLGMDSPTAVELAMGLEQRFGIQLPVMMLNDSLTVSNVTVRIVGKLMGNGQVDGEAQTAKESQAALVSATLTQHGSEEMTAEQRQAVPEDVCKLAREGVSLIS